MAEQKNRGVITLNSDKEFTVFITEASANPQSKIVACFTNSSCEENKTILPLFDALSSQYPELSFIKIDTDVCKVIPSVLGVSAVPTFHFYMGDKAVKQQTDSNTTSLQNNVRLFAQADEKQIDSMAQSSAKEASEKLLAEFTEGDVSVLLDNRARCANSLPGFPYDNVFKDDDSCLKSNCDPELLLQLGFKQQITLKSIKITAPPDGSGPKTVRLILNQQNISFDTARANDKAYKIELTPDNLTPDAKPIPVPIFKFNRIDTLTIFIESNQDGKPQTVLSRIILHGKKT
jgi:thiol-disulfide isomerase/thioredoxin